MSILPECQGDRRSRLLNALPAIAWSADAQTFRFTYVNPAAETLLGYPAERWLEEPDFWMKRLHPDDCHVALLCHNETVACRDHELVYRMIAADGRTVWLRDYVNVHHVDGKAVELFGVMVDITREREAEANFRRMVELSPDCIGVHVDGVYVYVNQAFVQLLGANSEAEVLGRAALSFVDLDFRDEVLERQARLQIGESVPYLRQKYERVDGSTIDVEVAALPLRYGNRDAVQVIARDISDRVRAEEELREAERLRASAEAKFRSLVEHSVVAVYMISGGRLTYINDTGLTMFGYTADELAAIDIWPLLVEQDRVARIRRKDGTLLHVAFYQNEIVLDGEPTVIGTAVDISENIHAQRALQESEQRYRALVEDVSDILYTLDLEGRFVSLSRSFERSTGYRVEEWIGRPFSDLFVPHASPLAGDAGFIREYNLESTSGAVVTVEVTSQPRCVDGVMTGTIGMARDVTEHRTFTRKLEESKRLSSLGQVAASLAHEFNNVLMGIQPFVEVISRNAGDVRKISEAVGHITRAIARGKRASQEILRFANPKDPQLAAIDVHGWLPTFLGQLTATLPASIVLTSSIDPTVRSIRGDREHLEQVITNLLFNARDAVGGSGTIHVGVAVERNLVRISVCDDGPGIPPQMLDRIFEPLFTTKRNGTGLGLAIARRLMEGQGGSVTAQNRPEGGSAFHLHVPAATASTPSLQPLSHAITGVRRILLVEDDHSVGAGLETLLNSEGYETTWVRAGGEACEAARRTRPEVAIIDVNLPDGSGVDLVPLLRAEHKDLPVVLSTGHVELSVSNNEKMRIISLMKPYELGDLLVAIGSVTG